MQETSALFREILGDPQHITETTLTIGDSSLLVDDRGDRITFGGFRILTSGGGPESGYDYHKLLSLETEAAALESGPAIGNTIAGQIHLRMLRPSADPEPMARLVPYIRLVATDRRKSEWIKKGVYYIDTRRHERNRSGEQELIIEGYDAMLKAETPYPSSRLAWPALDTDVVREIAYTMGVGIDKRTWKVMTDGNRIQYPAQYSCREVLSLIAIMYAGNWIITDLGDLRLVGLAEIPPESRLLIDTAGYTITFGGVRIRV